MGYRNRAEKAVGQVLISGTSVAAGGQTNIPVSFGRTYAEPPLVFVSMAGAPGGSNALVPRALNATTTGFTLYVYNTGAVNATWTNLPVNWQAEPA